MIKNIINRAKVKPFLLLILSIFTIITLTSCSNGSRTFSGIDENAVYATSGNYSITNKELWDELKWSANDKLEEEITSLVLSSYVDKIKETINQTGDSLLKRTYLTELEEFALASVYNQLEGEEVKKLDERRRINLENKFIDSYYLTEGKKLTVSEFFDEDGIELIAGKKFYMSKLHSYFYEKLAERVLGYEKLLEKIEEYNKDKEEEEYYYDTEEIIQYHLENYKYDVETKAIIVRFLNEDEINSTFKAYGIKVYKENYYFIPQGDMTVNDYSKHYDEFDVSLASNSEKCFNINALGGETIILQLFIEINNYIYTYRESLPNGILGNSENLTTNRRSITEKLVTLYLQDKVSSTPKEFISGWEENQLDAITYSYEDLEEIDLGFGVYVGADLSISGEDDQNRYTETGYSAGDFYYLIYKIDEAELSADKILCSDSNNEDKITNKELKAEIEVKMAWEELTDVSNSDSLAEEVTKVKVSIFDEALEISFAQKNADYSKTRKKAPSKDTLFTISYKKQKKSVTIDDVFKELELKDGQTTAVDLLSKKAIQESDEYKNITESDVKSYKRNLEAVLNLFANDQLSSQGYAASLGKYNFLMLYFHSADVDTIIDNYYKMNTASTKILTNYAKNDSIFKVMQKYATKSYENGFNISASNLLVYVDMDEDGMPDEDFNWDSKIIGSEVTYKEKSIELINYIIDRLKNTTSTQLSLLEQLVEEFNACQRFTNGIDVYDPEDEEGEYDPTEPETIWAEYRRAGLYIKIDAFESVTNTSSELTTSETYVPLHLKTRLKEIYNSKDFNYLDGIFQSEYVDYELYSNGKDGLLSRDGYNMLVVSAATEKSSAKFEAKDDINGIYTNITISYDEDKVEVIKDIYNDSDNVSLEQVKLFIYEYISMQTTNLFPSRITSAITDYLLPVYEKYTSEASQIELLFAKVLSSNIKFTESSNNSRLEQIMEINRRTSDDYLSDDDLGNNFVGWWDEILVGGQN